MLTVRQKLKLLALALGILISYLIFGLIRERVFRNPYGDGIHAENFEYATAFTAIQLIFYALFARTVLCFNGVDVTDSQKVVHKIYVFAAIFSGIANVTVNMALKWISFPLQIVIKAASPISVMVFGLLIARKSYLPQKYFFVLLLVFGVGMFLYQDECDLASENIIGLCLLGLSLIMDGLVGGMQELLKTSKPPVMLYMFYMNTWGSVLLISILAVTGEGRDLIEFSQRHPEILAHFGLAVVVGTFGQICVSSMVMNFGALVAESVTTLRKFLTVFLSVLVFGNKLNIRQWLAAGLVFLALLLDAFFNKKTRKISDEEKLEEIEKNKTDRLIVSQSNSPPSDLESKII